MSNANLTGNCAHQYQYKIERNIKKKNGEPVGAKKYRKKGNHTHKKKEKWAHAKNSPFSKNERPKKKKRWTRQPFF